MGFNSEYAKHVSEGYDHKLPKEKSTILLFFGFKYTTKRNYRTCEGGYTATQNHPGTIEIHKSPNVTIGNGNTALFYRYDEPKGQTKVLEDKIYGLLEKKYRSNEWKTFDPFATPYLEPNIRDYFNNHIVSIIQELGLEKRKWYENLLLILFIPFIIGIIVGLCIESMPLFGWSLGLGLVHLIVFGIFVSVQEKKYKSKHSFYELSVEHKAKVREEYLKTLTVHDKEIDPLLREYAILRGYDR